MKFQYPSDIRNMPPPEWIFHELLQKNSTALLYGPSNLGKSFLALEMLFALATQRDDVLKPTSQGRALYICGEGLAGLSVRLAAWEESRGVKLPENNPVFVGGTVQLADPKSRRQFVTAIRKEFGDDLPVVIIFDTLARCIVGLDENSARDMGMVVDGLEVVRQELGCTVLVVHHSTKQDPKTERGSGAIFGAVDTALCLRRDGSFLELTCPKQKNGHRAPPLRLDLAKRHGSCVLDANIKKKTEDQTANLRAVLTEAGAKKIILPKSTYIREMFPPRRWEWNGEAPVCAVEVVGARVHVEQVEPTDPYFKAWLGDDRRLRQRSPTDRSSANPFAYVCESPEFWAAGEERRAEILEERRQLREDRLGGRGEPYPATDDLDVAWWTWGACEMGIAQADVMRWYDLPRGMMQRAVKSWRKYGLLPFKSGA